MNLFKRAIALSLLLCVTATLCACGDNGGNATQPQNTTLSPDAAYRVTVTDFLDQPCTEGIVVCFLQNGQQVAMQTVNAQGVAEKTLTRGDYTVELMFTDSNASYYYDTNSVTLSAENTELTVQLAHVPGGEAVSLSSGGAEYAAYSLALGCNKVTLTPNQRNLFLFTPTQAGTYEVSVLGEGMQLGYYGAPHFVQSESVAEVTGNRFTVSVSASMIGTNGTGTTVMVVGVDAGTGDGCILSVRRIGEAERTLEDEPWSTYMTTAKLAPYTLPAGAQIREFDLTAKYTLVYNETDGFYHLNSADGPLVLVRLGEDSQYLACFKNILDRSGVVKYFFDDKGEFVKKESYSECLLEYFGYMDEETGLYPLTEDLKYIIQQRGEYSGWFDINHSLYLFKNANGDIIPGIDPETSWLFMCCYID